MIKPRPPHQAADKFLRLAKAVAALGMDFEDAVVGVEHELIESIGVALPKLSRAMQTLSQDLRRKAMTPEVPPPPPPKPTPILDLCGVLETAEAPPPATEVVPPKPGDAVRAHAAHPKVPAAVKAKASQYRGYVGCRDDRVLFVFHTANPEPRSFAWGQSPNGVSREWFDQLQFREATEDEAKADLPGPMEFDWEAEFAGKLMPESPSEGAHPVPAPAKRPKPAKAEPGDKLGKRQCWIARVAGKPAFRIYGHTQELAEGQLALKLPRESWPEASLALEFTNRSQDFNGVPTLSDLPPEKARQVVRAKLAEAEHESGSGFVAPMPEGDDQAEGDPANAPATAWAAWHSECGRFLFTIKAGDPDEAREFCGMELTNAQVDVLAFAPLDERHAGLPDWQAYDVDTWPEALDFLVAHRPTQMPLFTLRAWSADQAAGIVSMRFPPEDFRALSIAEFPKGESAGSLPDFETFDPEDMPADDTPPTSPAPAPGPAPDATPEVRAYPTESPRDPLATLPIGELGLRKPVLELVQSKGITLAGQLFDELDGDVLDGLLTEEQRDHVEKVVDVWERTRATLLEDCGGWLGEELTYACFRLGDAREFWGKLREAGATDAELRDAINKRFFVMGGADCRYRVGYHFQAGPAPAFFKGAAKPKRGQEPVLEGKPLLDRVRALLAIPTREAPAKGKATPSRAAGKAVKA